MSRKASRTLINKHHQLEKERRQAIAKGDNSSALKLAAELEQLGGIDQYQKASLQGQSTDRGGDTSKILLEWLPLEELKKSNTRLRLLEVGSLSTRNACSTSGVFDVTHIDLNSQEPGITQQDFMERPLPADTTEKFDMISLSLVLNFVADAAGRGEMLRRTLSFLYTVSTDTQATTTEFFPSLFMVLPRSCVDNSRYLTLKRLDELMVLLGYTKLKEKFTLKLAYSLWRKEKMVRHGQATMAKKEINPGRTRNNFAITLSSSADTKGLP